MRYCQSFLPDVACQSMKTSTALFLKFLKRVGGRQKAADILGIKVGQIGHIVCERRGISPKVAQAIDAHTNGEISKAALRPDLWGEQPVKRKPRNK